MRALKRDLYRMVPVHLQEPLYDFIFGGLIPFDCQEAMQVLEAPHGSINSSVGAFLEKHAATLDIAHGHIGYMMRWHRHGGLGGRVPR